MKKLFLALSLCAFVAAPAMAADHHGHAKKDKAVTAQEHAEHTDAAAPVAATKKKKKRTAKKVTTETTSEEGEMAPSETTTN
jgi:hypothetical protein